MAHLIQASAANEIETARVLFREYEGWFGISLCFQNFDDEVISLPGKYAPPEGRLYIAFENDEALGCIALRKIDEGVCEMKRLFLRESARGKGVGKMLIEKILEDAADIGYKLMRLDTYPPKMGKAVDLYKAYGFYEISSYYNNPHDDVLYMEKKL